MEKFLNVLTFVQTTPDRHRSSKVALHNLKTLKMKKFFVHRTKVSSNPDRKNAPYQLILRCEESIAANEVEGISLPNRNAPTKYLSIFAVESWPEVLEAKFKESPVTDAVLKALGV